MSEEQAKDLKALGSGDTNYNYAKPAYSLLERFPSESCEGMTIQILSPEFTSLCPLTGQPDFATMYVEYTARRWCVESKSWKLYLNSFRNHGEFHESCVNRIYNDLKNLLQPSTLFVQGRFTPRGGIPFWPERGERSAKGQLL